MLKSILSEQINRSEHKEGALYHQGTFTRWLVICWTAASRTIKYWMLARNTSCYVRFTLQPVELWICCKIAKLAGSISESRAGQSACCVSSFFQWPMMSSSFWPLPKSRKWRKYSETSWSVMLIFCHDCLESDLKRKNVCEQLMSGKLHTILCSWNNCVNIFLHRLVGLPG